MQEENLKFNSLKLLVKLTSTSIKVKIYNENDIKNAVSTKFVWHVELCVNMNITFLYAMNIGNQALQYIYSL